MKKTVTFASKFANDSDYKFSGHVDVSKYSKFSDKFLSKVSQNSIWPKMNQIACRATLR